MKEYVMRYENEVLQLLPDKMQELVRCKDCKYWQDNNDGYPHRDCKWNQYETPDPDDFCSAGERRTMMSDREKVIVGLERCKQYNKVNCDKCPYDYNGRGDGKSECTAELATDALALLKAQQKLIDEITQRRANNGAFD